MTDYNKKYYEKNKEYFADKSNRWREENRDKYNEYSREYKKEYYSKPENRLKRLVSNAKSRAKKDGIVFDLDVDKLTINMVCPLLGIVIDYELGKGHSPNSPSLDRVDPTKGYTNENTWVISHKANRIKNDATLDELELILTRLKEHYNV